MSDLTKKDNEILTLKEEKATTEIALKSALQEKASVDKALEVLKSDMGKVTEHPNLINIHRVVVQKCDCGLLQHFTNGIFMQRILTFFVVVFFFY